MDAPAQPWPPAVGAYAEERELFRLLQVNGRRLLLPLIPSGAARGGGEGHSAFLTASPRRPVVLPEGGPSPTRRAVPGSCGNARAGVPG